MTVVYHTKIEFIPVAKNGSEKLGVNAECKYWVGESTFRITCSQFGKTKSEAETKILEFLSNGDVKVECVVENE